MLGTSVVGEFAARWEDGDGRLEVMPASPGESLLEMLVDGGANGAPLSVAKHVDKIQVGGHHVLKFPREDEFFDDAPPVSECFHSARHTDAPLMHAKTLLAKFHAVRVDQVLGIAGAQELTHLDRPRLSRFLALPTQPCPSYPSGLIWQCTIVDGFVKSRKSSEQPVGIGATWDGHEIPDVLGASASRTW